MIEITALAFSHVIDPVPLEMVTVTFSKHPIAVALPLVPLTFIDVLICVYHSALTLRHSSHPEPIISISILVEECASSVFLVFEPISCVLSSQLAAFVSPASTLSVTLIMLPKTLIFVSVLVELNAESILLVVFPVSNVPGCMLPLLTLDASVLLSLFLLNKCKNDLFHTLTQ
jgi:hypothetical protein